MFPVLCVLAAIAVGLAAVLELLGEDARGSGAAGPAEPGTAAPSPPRTGGTSPGDLAPLDRDLGARESTGTAPTAPARTRSFDGVGSLRGTLEPPPGGAIPERWTLVLGPSPWLPGKERAETRRVEVTGGEAEFHVESLPMGGYRVRAQAEGLFTHPLEVQIDTVSRSPYVVLRLVPAGFVQGVVEDTDGNRVEGAELHLVPRPSGEARLARTDVLGRYRFDGVVDGEYDLVLGPPQAPLVPTKRLAFRTPALTVPTLEVAPFAALELLVTDDGGAPVGDANVRGTGSAGGAFDLQTDAAGTALANYLPAGRFRVRADHGDFGSAYEAIDLATSERRALTLVLRRDP